jgi:hypothetical protein
MGLQVLLTITLNEKAVDKDEKEKNDKESLTKRLSKSMSDIDLDSDDDDFYKMDVKSSGKFSRKAEFQDLSGFTGLTIDNDMLKNMIGNYQTQCFPEVLEKPNRIPKTCWIKDDGNFCTVFKDYDWNPVKLYLKPGMVDMKENWTKEVVLEEFPLDYTTDIEKVLLEQGDKEVISTLKKSKLAGHPLALALMKSSSEIVTEFKGMEAVASILGNKEPSETDEETGGEIWRDVKSMRALLKDKPMPKKKGKGVTRIVKVVALESFIHARVYYKASFTGEVSTDHTNEKFEGQRYWNFPLKYLFQYNDIPNAAIIYEDIELHFYSEVKVAMDNDDFEWKQDEEGRWMKSYD